MILTDACYSTIEEALESSAPVDGYWVQLSPGPFDYRILEASGDEFSFRLTRTSQLVHGCERRRKSDFLVVAIVDCDEPLQLNNRPIGIGSSFEYSAGQEIDYLIRKGSIILEISIPAELAARRGWQSFEREPINLPLHVIRPFQNAARSWLRAASLPSWDPEEIPGLRPERLMVAVENLLEARTSLPSDTRIGNDGPSRYLVKRAIQFVSDLDDPADHAITVLAEQIGVTGRTLQYAFNDQFGVSPYRFFLFQRLQKVRRALSRSPLKRGTVTQAAMDAGFTDISRMGQMYLRHFGEMPSQTLRA